MHLLVDATVMALVPEPTAPGNLIPYLDNVVDSYKHHSRKASANRSNPPPGLHALGPI